MSIVERMSSRQAKWFLTIASILAVIGYGINFQYSFEQAEHRYRKIIVQYCRDHLNSKPPEADLQRWTIYAFRGVNLEKIKQEGFIDKKA